MLTESEIARYKRHLLLKEVGGQGQQKLKDSRVLVIGAGGLGSPLLLYLAAAGVGLIGVVDDDEVSLDNLQRQIVHGTPDIGILKTDSADQALARLNPDIQIRRHATRLDAHNAREIIAQYDIVADGSDNFATRYLVNDACWFEQRPLVTAALGPFDGQLTTFRSFETDSSGIPRPNYRCLFPEPPPPGTVAPCAEAGILGAVAGVMGTLQALEVLKELLGIGEGLVGRLLIYDARACRFETPTIRDMWESEANLNAQADP
jgi:molybdopterin/thiamine biosynthesis adenylyltransferase